LRVTGNVRRYFVPCYLEKYMKRALAIELEEAGDSMECRPLQVFYKGQVICMILS